MADSSISMRWELRNEYFLHENPNLAVLHMSQYSFCWDSVGMDIEDLESVGMDRNRYHSKPQQVLPKRISKDFAIS